MEVISSYTINNDGVCYLNNNQLFIKNTQNQKDLNYNTLKPSKNKNEIIIWGKGIKGLS